MARPVTEIAATSADARAALSRAATIVADAVRDEATAQVDAVTAPKLSASGDSASFVAIVSGVAYKLYLQEVK